MRGECEFELAKRKNVKRIKFLFPIDVREEKKRNKESSLKEKDNKKKIFSFSQTEMFLFYDSVTFFIFFMFFIQCLVFPPTSGEPTFTIVAIPDTQYYTAYHKEIFQWQAYWTCACKDDMNTAVAVHLGDIVEHANMEEHEWLTAKQGFRYLRRCKVPTTALPGNHDTTKEDKTLYDRYLPYNFFRMWFDEPEISDDGYEYHVYDVSTSRNGYIRFSKSGQYFIQLHIGYIPYLPEQMDIIAWADNVIKSHPNDLVIISTHYAASDCFSVIQPNVYHLMEENCNVLMAFGGHVFECGGERTHSVTNVCGSVRYIFVTDYQGRKEGGDGWLRFYNFYKDDSVNGSINEPAWNMCAATFTPKHKKYETDENSFFSLNISSGEIGEGCPSSLQYTCGQNYIPNGMIYVVVCIVISVAFFIALLAP